MSEEFREVVVKEEYTFEESNVNLSNLRFMHDPNQKCGEIFWGLEGHFTFVCSLCHQRCSDLLSFGEHIRDVHSLTENEASIWNALEDDPMPVEKEHSSPKTGLVQVDKAEGVVQDVNSTMLDDAHSEESDQSEWDPFESKSKGSKRKISEYKPYCCFTCGKVFVSFQWYRNHYRKQHPDMIEKDDPIASEADNETTFVTKVPVEMVCRYCLGAFSDKAKYHNHMANDHPSPKIYSCPQCPSLFSNLKQRTFHLDIHEGIKRMQCTMCPKAFTHPNNLQKHIDSCHLKLRPFACRFCDLKCGQKSSLVIHERTHTNERPYQCDECGKSFIAQVKLTSHMLRHKNIKNFKCPYCDKAFYSFKCLKPHIRTHTKETPYSCDVCGQKFRARSSLQSHKKLHSGLKRYVCKLCGKRFAQGPGLYSHMKSHRDVEKC